METISKSFIVTETAAIIGLLVKLGIVFDSLRWEIVFDAFTKEHLYKYKSSQNCHIWTNVR